MLGLRKFKGVQLDVWQGKSNDFVCDIRSDSSDWQKFLDAAQNAAAAHASISFEPTASEQTRSAVQAVRDWLDCFDGDLKLQRVTFIAPDAESYHHLQSYLLSLVVDDDAII